MSTRLTLDEIRRPLNDTMTKLAGEDGQYWLDALNKFNRKENPFPIDGHATVTDKPVFKAPKPARLKIKIVVDHDRSMTKAVKAGRYDYVNADMNADNFPPEEGKTGMEEQGVEFFAYDHDPSTEEVEADMDREGFIAIGPNQLLAIGEQHPELQRKNPLVALRQKWRDSVGGLCVPYLDGRGSGRRLDLFIFGGGWSRRCLFPAVRKGT